MVDPRHSYIQFDVKVKLGAEPAAPATDSVVFIDSGVEGLIETFSIIGSDGAILERCVNSHFMAQALKTIQSSSINKAQQITQGFNGAAPNLGAKYLFPASANTDGQTQTKTFTFNLSLSALLNCDRLLPLGFLAGSALSLDLQLSPSATALCGTNCTALSYELSNVSYNASVITYDQATVSLLQALMNEIGGVQIHSKGWHQLGTNSIATQTGGGAVAQTLSLPCRTRSTIAIAHLMRDSTDINNEAKASISTRRTRLMSQYQHSIGGVRYPIRPVQSLSNNNPAGAFVQIQKAFYTTNDQHLGGVLALGTTGDDVGGADTYNYYPSTDLGCSYMVVQGFESAPGSNLESGLDLSSQSANIQFEMTMIPSTTGASQVDSYVLADRLFTFTASGTILASN